jgi:hypothetical protein
MHASKVLTRLIVTFLGIDVACLIIREVYLSAIAIADNKTTTSQFRCEILYGYPDVDAAHKVQVDIVYSIKKNS